MSAATREISWISLFIAAVVALGMCSTPVAGTIVVERPSPPGPGWVWVPPEYRTVTRQIWVEERIESVAERVWVPPIYAWRPVCNSDGVIRYEYVQISAGGYQTRYRDVLVPAHWETVTERILIRPGYWKRIEPVPPPVILPAPSTNVPSVGVEGYKTPTGNEGSGPFTPLYEWPDVKR